MEKDRGLRYGEPSMGGGKSKLKGALRARGLFLIKKPGSQWLKNEQRRPSSKGGGLGCKGITLPSKRKKL